LCPVTVGRRVTSGPYGRMTRERRKRGHVLTAGTPTTPSFEEIYARHAVTYDALIEREDYQGRLLPALAEISSLEGASVVEFGTGSGRLTRLLAPLVGRIRAYDASAHMLGVAERHLIAMGLTN
jgi:ubiquinone/menaquinone biosynthesis C-methylase UbiE